MQNSDSCTKLRKGTLSKFKIGLKLNITIILKLELTLIQVRFENFTNTISLIRIMFFRPIEEFLAFIIIDQRKY